MRIMRKILLMAAVFMAVMFRMYRIGYCDEYPKLVSVEEYKGDIRQYITNEQGNKKVVVTEKEVIYYNTDGSEKKKITLGEFEKGWASRDGSYVGYGDDDLSLLDSNGNLLKTIISPSKNKYGVRKEGTPWYQIRQVAISTNGVIGIIYTDVKEGESSFLMMYNAHGRGIGGVYEGKYVGVIKNVVGDDFMIDTTGHGFSSISSMTYITPGKYITYWEGIPSHPVYGDRYDKLWEQDISVDSPNIDISFDRQYIAISGRYTNILSTITTPMEEEEGLAVYVYDRSFNKLFEKSMEKSACTKAVFDLTNRYILLSGIGIQIFDIENESGVPFYYKGPLYIDTLPDQVYYYQVVTTNNNLSKLYFVQLYLNTISRAIKYYVGKITLQDSIEIKKEITGTFTDDGSEPLYISFANNHLKFAIYNKCYEYEMEE